MNVIRELRKFKTKSAIAKIRMLIILLVMLITSSYAWFELGYEANMSNIRGKVIEWNVEYSINEEAIQTQEFTVKIDEFYPGMTNFEENIVIRNLSNTTSDIKYELISVRLFGEEILEELEANGNITGAGTTKNIFSTEDYPFDVGYYYDKDKLEDKYIDDVSTPDSVAKVTFFANWTYEREGNILSYEENDELDTYYGETAYEYYENNELAAEYSPLEITLKITTTRAGFASGN